MRGSVCASTYNTMELILDFYCMFEPSTWAPLIYTTLGGPAGLGTVGSTSRIKTISAYCFAKWTAMMMNGGKAQAKSTAAATAGDCTAITSLKTAIQNIPRRGMAWRNLDRVGLL